MTRSDIYFSDNFFSAGLTDIYDEHKQIIGTLDLKSAFTSSVTVLDTSQNIVCEGRFRTLSNRWVVTDHAGNELGVLRQRMSFFSKKFEYEAGARGYIAIESEAFSRDYQLLDESGNTVAEFEKISGFFQSPAYRLSNLSDVFSDSELVAVVMGINMIQKRNSASAGNAAT
ncbi:MAG TPA: hypothetical protein VIG80_07870 [Bacillaceae bacterium]